MGIAVGDDPEILVEWVDKGVRWLAMAADFALLIRSASQLAKRLREHEPRAI
jgi:2-keto-3-deoxy-L-rhamnonate aldolase RhmA